MALKADQAIGIFDSGLGGLTVTQAVRQILPTEKIIYFGDTAHLPYGEKSSEAINYYAREISRFLLAQNCKVILIACNTASALAYRTVKKEVGQKALVLDVIRPAVQEIVEDKALQRVGVIGTKATIQSESYSRQIKTLRPEVEVVSMATGLFVPMIEEGFIFDNISNAIISSYLSKDNLQNLDALVLGCTHYPIIKNQIRKYYNFSRSVRIIDSSLTAANRLKEELIKRELIRKPSNNKKAEDQFFVSDYSSFFDNLTDIFFEAPIKLQKIDLWENT